MLTTILQLHTTLTVRTCVHRIETFQDPEQTISDVEETRRIGGLLQIHLLVESFVLLAYGIEEHQPDLIAISIGRVGKKMAHGSLSLSKLLSRLYIVLRLSYLLALCSSRDGRGKREDKEEEESK